MTTTSRPARARQAAAAVALLLTLAACGNISPTPADSVGADSPAPASTPPATSTPEAPATPSSPARTEPPRVSGTPRGNTPTAVDERNPGDVAWAALTTMYTSDTRVDAMPRNAIVRAARYMTPAYAAELAAASPPPASGAQWQQWVDHQAYTTANVTEANDAGRPADTATTAYRQYAVSVTAHGSGKYTDTAQVGTAFVELTRTAEKWQVNAVQLR